MTMRATQKKMMSKPVTSTDDGRKALMSGVSSGQPMVENGISADENQVSSTSASRRSAPVEPAAAALASASASVLATKMLPCSSYQAGIWWPHHNWREMHQSYVVQPLVVGAAPVFRHELDLAVGHFFQRRFGDRFAGEESALRRRLAHGDEPLVGQHRLDDDAGAVAARHHQLVRLDLFQQAQR